MSRARKLTAEQRQHVKERNDTYVRLRLEAAKHSPATLARELGVSEQTIVREINPLRRL